MIPARQILDTPNNHRIDDNVTYESKRNEAQRLGDAWIRCQSLQKRYAIAQCIVATSRRALYAPRKASKRLYV